MSKAINWDRTLSFSLLVTILIQTASALLWAGGAEARIDSLEQHGGDTVAVAERLARLEEQSRTTQEALLRIERRLEADHD